MNTPAEREAAMRQAREVLASSTSTGAACTADRRALWGIDAPEAHNLMRQLARRRHEADSRARQQQKVCRLFGHRPDGGEVA